MVHGLIAVVVIAVAVLGFWSFSSPGQETAAQGPVTSTPAPDPATPAPETVAPLPEAAPAPVGPVFAPIHVYNGTSITGLAADIADQFAAGGWQVLDTAGSPVQDVATTTVYYTEGDPVQQQAAAGLVEQFPDVNGPAARYFDLPPGAADGLVVVATGNWRP